MFCNSVLSIECTYTSASACNPSVNEFDWSLPGGSFSDGSNAFDPSELAQSSRGTKRLNRSHND